MHLSLIEFDDTIGPNIFYSIPDQLDIEIDEILRDLMDLHMDSDYFEYEVEHIKIAGLRCDINSHWNRGKKINLILMIYAGALFKGKNLIVFQPILRKYSIKFQKISNLFKGFHLNNQEFIGESKEIARQFEKIHILLRECFKECQNQLFHLYLGHILVLGLDNVGKYEIINLISKKDFTPLESESTFFKNYVNLLARNFVFDVHDIEDEAPNILEQVDNRPLGIMYFLRCDCSPTEFDKMKQEFYNIIDYYFLDEKRNQKLENTTPILILGNCGESSDNFDLKKYRFMFKDSFPKLNILFKFYTKINTVIIFDYFFWLFQEIIKNQTIDKNC